MSVLLIAARRIFFATASATMVLLGTIGCMPPRLDTSIFHRNDADAALDVETTYDIADRDAQPSPDGDDLESSTGGDTSSDSNLSNEVDTPDLHVSTDLSADDIFDLAASIDLSVDVEASCGNRAGCPIGFECRTDESGDPRCVCATGGCADCETGVNGRACLAGEYCDDNNKCRCGEMTEPVRPDAVDSCYTGSYVCIKKNRPCATGYECRIGDCRCKVPLGDSSLCWQHPYPQGINTSSLAFVSEMEIYAAVGLSGLIRFDGASWNGVELPVSAEVNTIISPDGSTLLAVGAKGKCFRRIGNIWDDVSPAGVQADLKGIWGLNAYDFFVGASDGTILHFKDAKWTVSHIPSPGDSIAAIWGTSNQLAYAVGQSNNMALVLRYDGQDWMPVDVESVAGGKFSSVVGTGPNDIYVSGVGGLYHFDGKEWKPVPTFNVNVPGIWQRDASHLWVGRTNPGSCTYDLLVGSAQTSWQNVQYAVFDVETCFRISAIAGSGDRVVVAGVGGYISYFDGLTWKLIGNPAHYGHWSATLTTAGDAVYSAGPNGSVLKLDTDGWQTSMYPTTYLSLGSIWAQSSSAVFWVGTEFGETVIQKFNGQTWANMLAGDHGLSGLRGVHGSAGDNIFAIGDTIARYDGKTWSKVAKTPPFTLNRVWVFSPQHFIAIGGKNALELKQGEWIEHNGIATSPLSAIWASSETEVFAVGGNGTIVSFNGVEWQEMVSGVANYLFSVWGTGSTDVYAVGWGVVLHYNGTKWSVLYQVPFSSLALESITGNSLGDTWIGGQGGVILHFYR